MSILQFPIVYRKIQHVFPMSLDKDVDNSSNISAISFLKKYCVSKKVIHYLIFYVIQFEAIETLQMSQATHKVLSIL